MQLIFDKGAMNTQGGMSSVFNKWYWENRVSICRMELDAFLKPYMEIN